MKRFYFRPIPKLTVFSLAMLAVLVGLGVWQIQRLHWKLGLIATMNRNMQVRPVSLDTGSSPVEGSETDYLHVTVRGRFEHAKESYLFATAPGGGGAVYHVLTPLTTDDGRVYMVDRGIVPKDKLNSASRAAGQVQGDVRVTGYWRGAQAPGFFTPAPDLAHRMFYERDIAAIAALDRVRLAEPGVVEADATPNPGGWPKGGQAVVDLPNNHLQYAITWFALALGLVVVYLAYHQAQGRLGWRE